MAFQKIGKRLLWLEELYADCGQWFEVSEILQDGSGKAGIQRSEFFRTKRHGVVQAINGAVQNSALRDDEAYYHEMAHCAVNSCTEEPRTALVIGSDGGMLRELVKYPCFRLIVAVDIDENAVEAVKKFLPSIPEGAWEDSRVEFVRMDGAVFAQKAKEAGRRFDIIIVDSPDPIGCAASLFRPEFNHDLASILTSHGILLRQTGSSVLQPDEMPANYWKMKTAFPDGDVGVFVTSVSSYIGGYFTFVAASAQKNVFNVSEMILKRRLRMRIDPAAVESLRWYSPEMHRAARVLPAGLKRDLEKLGWGKVLLLDLYQCDFSVITSPEKIAEFKQGICEVIGMKTYGETIITPDFGEAKTRTAGLSSLQWIETSSLVGHYAKHLRIAFQDIFTCAELRVADAVRFSMTFFDAEEAYWLVVPRGRKTPQPEPEITAHKTTREGEKFFTTDFPFTLDRSRIRTYEM